MDVSDVGQDPEYWPGRRVLVTGADGFIGSHLCDRLVELGARVPATVRGRSDSGTSRFSLRNLTPVVDRLEAIHPIDISSGDTTAIVIDIRPQILFHLAANAYVPYSFDRPHEVHRTNATGTLNILEAARRMPDLERLVLCSSSEV